MATAEQKEEKPSFRVRYFPIPGRGAQVRLAMTVAGFAFEDEFVTFAEHRAAKQAGTSISLPELVIYAKDGKQLLKVYQARSILRYIGGLSGLNGDNAMERLRVDEILDTADDIFVTIPNDKDAAKKKELREASIAKDGKLTQILNRLLARLQENEAAGNKNGFIVGDKLTIADTGLSSSLKHLTSGFFDHIPQDLLSKDYPALQKYVNTVDNVDSIKKFNTAFGQRMQDFKDDAKQASVKVVTYPGKTCPDVAAK